MNLRSALFLSIIITIAASCTKISNTDIGSDLIPPIDNIHTFETNFDVTTMNFIDNDTVKPIRTDNLVLGRISDDPVFGKITGIINLEVMPTSFPFTYTGVKDSIRNLDSIVLVLGYKGYWGDSMLNTNLNVYEISQINQMESDSVYSTRRQYQHYSTVLGSATVDVKKLLVDSIQPNKEAVNKNQIRIKITDPTFQQRVFNPPVGPGLFDSTKSYRNRFAGFAIVPDTASAASPNALLVVNLSDTNTKLAVYYNYKITGDTTRRKTVDYFRLTPYANFSNNIIRNAKTAAGTDAEYVASLASQVDTFSFISTRPDAPYTKIHIPGLDTISNKIIHRAELVITEIPDPSNLNKKLTAPNLFLSAYSQDFSRRFMLPGGDVQYSASGVTNFNDFGGVPFKRNVNNLQLTGYTFDLTHYVQSIATKKSKTYDLVLWAPFADYVYSNEIGNIGIPLAGSGTVNTLAIGRVKLGGGTISQTGPNAPYRMRLRIIYTRI